ncbi:aminotransferase class V-fold PLP-dependent enzyme [Salisaeta longa]|uniref:aminotransferase class V-fold PLP-dependent enzyme n=1 Tax=Salisaeta longa TaxID=503170 RepID=UPI0003B43817|nr:aminotransferase class V-fold PLP-dependent enzyme [Salisaeta longa]
MPIDVARARAETPGCTNVLHLNNAGAALPPQGVVEAQIQHLRREASTGGYEAAADAEAARHRTYEAIATLLHASAEEIALAPNATRAWDMAFYGLPLTAGDRILTHRATYASNGLAMLQRAEQTGATVEVVPSTPEGTIDVGALEQRMDNDVALIALTHMPTNGGLVNPAEAVGAVARAAGVPYLLDACQSAGQRPLDVAAIGCTMCAATGRKFLRGPRGTGFLYVRRDWIDRLTPPFIDLHAATWTGPSSYEWRPDAKRFETWERYVAGTIGLGVAVDYALDWGLEAIWDRIRDLGAALRARLQDVPSVVVRDAGREQSGIVTFSSDACEAASIQRALRAQDINVSVSTPSSTYLDAAARDLPDLVRASVHYYNTTDELDRFTHALSTILASV